MRNQLKFFFVSALLTFVFISAEAQIKIGPGIAYGSEIKNIGITARGVYDIDETWAGSGSFTYFLEKDFTNLWELNFDAHYNVSSNDQFTFYPLAGLNIAGFSIDLNTGIPGFGKVSTTKVGLNAGAGAELAISDSVIGVGEIKYTISDFDQLVINIGVLFILGGGK